MASENVAYSDFMKMQENEHVLQTCTRDTFKHARICIIFAFHVVAAARCCVFENVIEAAARLLLFDSSMFEACENVLLMRDVCTFLILYKMHRNQLSLKM